MKPTWSPYMLVMLAAAMICMFIAVYVWLYRRKNSEAVPLISLMVGIIEWIAATILGMLDQNLSHKILWAKIEYIGIVSVPLLLLVFVLYHSGSKQKLTGKRLVWLTLIPVVTLILAWTNEYHGLIWARYIPYLQDGLAYSEKTYGPGFWIYWGYSYLLLAVATIVTIRSMLGKAGLFRWQSITVAIGILAPWAANLLYILHVNFIQNLDLTPLAFGFTGILLAFGMIQWQLFDIKPIAQAAVIGSMADGLMILDSQDRIVEVNPAAQDILGLGVQELVGKQMEQVITNLLPSGVLSHQMNEKTVEIDLTNGKENRIFELSDSPFYEKPGTPGGKIIFLHDVTDRKQLEERLRETERKYAEEALRESEDKFKYFLDHSTVGTSFTLPTGEINVNQAFCDMLGYSVSELKNKNWQEITLPEDIELTQRGVEQLLSGKRDSMRLIKRFIHKDGSVVWVDLSSSVRRDADCKPLYLMSSVIDITERKRSEKLMSLQSEVLKVINTDIPVEETAAKVVAVIKQEAGFDAVGLRLRTESDYPFVASLGYSEGFLKAENTLTIRDPNGGLCRNEDGTVSLECTCGLIVSGKANSANPLFTPGGSAWTNNSLPFLDVPQEADPRLHPRNRCIHVGFLSLALIPIRSGGEILGLLHLADRRQDRFTPEAIHFFEGIGLSIGGALARKQAEEALAAKAQEWQTTFDASNDAIWLLDKDQRVVRSNKMADQIWQLPSGSALRKHCWEIVHSTAEPIPDCPFQRARRSKHRETLELQLGEGWYQVTADPILDAAGKFTGAVHLVSDITERKRAEEKQKALASELDRSNKELEQFAYVASHDLQEPLRMVSSYMQLIAKRYQGKLDSDADEFIAFAVDGSVRMQRMINDLLGYSRVGTRGRPFEPTNIESVLGNVLENLKLAIEESSAAVTHDPLPTVSGDESQLAQLFQNLVGNSIKFHGDEPPRVHISARKTSDVWEFSVRDHGIGIAPQFFDRVFLIFQRLSTRAEYPGSGIGLAICKKIVERHGGRIWIESKPGEGATFFFTLPAG